MYITYKNFKCSDVSRLSAQDVLKYKSFSNIQLISVYKVYRRRWNGHGDNYRLFGVFFQMSHAEDYVEGNRSRGSSWIIEIESRVLFQSAATFILLDFEKTYGLFKPFHNKKETNLKPKFTDVINLIENKSSWSNWIYGIFRTEKTIGISEEFVALEFYDLKAENIIESDAEYSKPLRFRVDCLANCLSYQTLNKKSPQCI